MFPYICFIEPTLLNRAVLSTKLEAVPIAEACRFAVKMHTAAIGTAS